MPKRYRCDASCSQEDQRLTLDLGLSQPKQSDVYVEKYNCDARNTDYPAGPREGVF